MSFPEPGTPEYEALAANTAALIDRMENPSPEALAQVARHVAAEAARLGSWVLEERYGPPGNTRTLHGPLRVVRVFALAGNPYFGRVVATVAPPDGPEHIAKVCSLQPTEAP